MTTKVKLLRPLDGKDAGHVADYPDGDAKRLEKRGIVQILADKAAEAPENKMAPSVQNKAAPSRAKKGH
jgi:hypothetical protein